LFKLKQENKSISNQALWYLCGQAGAYIFAILVPVVLSRIFSRDDYGIYGQFLMIFFFLEHILQFGFKSSLSYFLPTNDIFCIKTFQRERKSS